MREFHFVNPHPYLVVYGRLDGVSRLWRLELDNRFELIDIGVDRMDAFMKERSLAYAATAKRLGLAK